MSDAIFTPAVNFDLFLSYNASDRDAVKIVRQLLQLRGIASFFDREHLAAGLPWLPALEDGLRRSKAVAVFFGSSGLGAIEKREMWWALDHQAQEEKAGRTFPVIPVLLPNADTNAGFLFLNTWVDLRRDLTDPAALGALVRALRGASPLAPDVDTAPPPCPYRGLRAFGEEDAALFFGRKAFAERLLTVILRSNLTAVVGPSGSGKSSVVQAGLLPLLRRQRAPSATWEAISFTPGHRPFHNLAGALAPFVSHGVSGADLLEETRKLGDGLQASKFRLEDAVKLARENSEGADRLLLVVDQFEELFTLTPERDRSTFVESLLDAIVHAPLHVLFTLRADFYGHAIAVSRALSDRLETSQVNLGGMSRDELAQVIREPARCVGLEFEPGLADRMLDDVKVEPGNLPLLEFALTELWTARKGRLVTHAAYNEAGAVQGAIAKRAEAVFHSLTNDQQRAARRLFTRLVRVARPDEDVGDTRQRVAGSDLDESAWRVARILADARLLVTGREESSEHETVEVAHEALIRHWDRLRGWLDEDRESTRASISPAGSLRS